MSFLIYIHWLLWCY